MLSNIYAYGFKIDRLLGTIIQSSARAIHARALGCRRSKSTSTERVRCESRHGNEIRMLVRINQLLYNDWTYQWSGDDGYFKTSLSL